MLGETISHYRILEKLGQGGMGEVYLAEDIRLGRKVALKFLAPELARDGESLVRFQREARAAAELSHPNIATIYDFDDVDGRPFLALEYLQGQTLRDRIAQGPLPIDDVVRIGTALAAGLADAHSHGIVHRDIKSANIMRTDKGEVKILDFGLAHRGDITQLTRPGTTLGTMHYMSPEQARGEVADERSDIWSLGIVLYECLTGRLPFIGEGASILEQIKSQDPEPLTALRTGIPMELEQAVLRCLEKDAQLRYQHSDELLASLRAFESRQNATLNSSSPHTTTRSTKPNRSPALRWLPAAAVIALVVLFAWLRPWERGAPPSGAERMSSPRVIPLLAEESGASSATWSPTGSLIAYQSEGDIWLCDLDGSNPINLSRSPNSGEGYPAWSPDGQKIAFYADLDGPGIYTMTLTGGNVRKLRPVNPSLASNALQEIQWFRSDQLIYADVDSAGRSDTYRLELENGSVVCLTSSAPEGTYRGRVSPNGTQLIYQRPILGVDVETYILNLETGDIHDIPLLARGGFWAPSGDAIFLISTVDGSRDLWVQSIEPSSGRPIGDARRLTTSLALQHLSFSPEGTRAVATQSRDTSNLWSFPSAGAPTLDLSRGVRLTDDSFSHSWARWLPDGNSFIDVSNRRGVSNVWVVDAQSGKRQRVREELSGYGIPSPNGSWILIAVFGDEGVRAFPYLTRRDGSQFRPLDETLKDRFPFFLVTDWSDDGRRLAFHTKVGEPWRFGVAEIDQDTGTLLSLELLETPGGIPFFSPDGRHLVFQDTRDGKDDLFLTSIDGGEVFRLTDDARTEWISGWEAEPSALYYKLGNTDEVYRLEMNSDARPLGKPRLWFGGEGDIRAAQWLDFRDGRAIGAMRRSQSSLWTLEFTAKK